MIDLLPVPEAEAAASAANPKGFGEPVALAPAKPQTAVCAESPTLLSLIATAARDPAVDVAKMQALLDMQERVEARQAEAAFNEALARLTRVLPRVKKNGVVEYPDKSGKPKPAFTFAKWEDIDRAIRPLLEAEGFSLSFNSAPRPDGGGIVVTGTLLHGGGHSRSASIPLALDASGGKNNLQGMGSTFSYGKRYTTTMLLNLVFENEDDCGVAGGKSYLNAEQKQHITKLLRETKADLDGFLDYVGAPSVEDIEAKHYAMAVNALETKRRHIEARRGQDAAGA